MGTLSSIFDPRSVALIGASDVEGSVGRVTLENLLGSKHIKAYPVNPHKEMLLGRECYSDVGSVPGHTDLAVIATPARGVPGIVEECGKAGVGGVVIISGGFKETGAEGIALERQISDIRKRYAMRILGPNCLGFVRPNAGLNTMFIETAPPPGDIAFISQSGALGAAILDWAEEAHVGFSMFASLGSMMNVGFGDVIDFLGEDLDTRSILIYMEGVGDARQFMSAARAFALRKPIIVLKPGRFAESAKAARSHTGVMAGDDAIYEAAFKRVGVVRVMEIAALFDAAAALNSQRLPGGPRLAIVTSAGGPGVMATDALMDRGGELARLAPETVEALNNALPAYWSKGNPVDLLGDADIARYEKAIGACLADPGVDGVLVIYVPMKTAKSEDVARAVMDSAKETGKPVIAAWMGGRQVRAGREMLVQNNIPAYDTPEQAVKTYVNMFRYKRNLGLLYETPSELPERGAPDKAPLREIIRGAALEGRTLLNERESKDFLVSYGIPTTLPRITRTVEEALRLAKEIGYPLVIKIVSPDISHKSDVGGVIVGVNSDDQLKEAYAGMTEEVKERAPEAAIKGIALQKMVGAVDYELILGSKRDKDFGSVILFGMGGTTAELIRDFSIALPPLNQTLAKRLMEETKAYRLVQGYRGKTPANLEEIERILVAFSNLIVDFPEITEIDINPLAVSHGTPCALDARIVLETQPIDYPSPYPHLVITPYPARLITDWKLPDGTRVVLRPIKPEDEPLERELFASLSQETLRKRLFSSFGEITHERLVLFCNIDYDRQLALVAEITENGRRKIIGVARLFADLDKKSGEFALVIHDGFQRRGLGYKFMQILIERAKKKGLDEMVGEVLTENEKMLGLARKLGFTRKWLEGGVTRVTLPLK
ncbi:MAG TPA: bifunctional acetate--CoA ligase family protein/GNAT family N-acetyltransferase [Syntrophorhabdaceae bacterium]|jgi:acetyltransferase